MDEVVFIVSGFSAHMMMYGRDKSKIREPGRWKEKNKKRKHTGIFVRKRERERERKIENSEEREKERIKRTSRRKYNIRRIRALAHIQSTTSRARGNT